MILPVYYWQLGIMLQSLHLQYFRSHEDLKIDFSERATLIVGPNASGKTSIIEAIHLLATGQSFRAGKVEEMVGFSAEWTRITGNLSALSGDITDEDAGEEPEQTELSVLLTRGMLQGKKTHHKHFSVNGINRQLHKMLGQLQTAVFRPEDMRIIEGSPSRRRRFLDEVIGSFDAEYLRSAKTYEQSLKRYNKLLETVRDNRQPTTILEYWERSMVKHGEYLQRQREQFLLATKQVSFAVRLQVEYKPSIITQERMDHYQERAVAAGHSLIGPHKDDFSVSCDVQDLWRGQLSQFHNVALYGSRGQQRLAVLWLKACQLNYIESQTGQKPLLLLDDIFSELDEENQQVVVKLINNHQAIVTSADQLVASFLPKNTAKLQLE